MACKRRPFLGTVLAFSLLAIGGAFPSGEVSNQSSYPDIIDWFVVGIDDGYGIFAFVTSPTNWTMAKEVCDSYSVHIGGITSRARADMIIFGLNYYLNETMIDSHEMWTSARESRDFRMFRWENEDGTSSPADESAVEIWSSDPVQDLPYQLCGTFSAAQNFSTLSTRLCSDLVPGVICQVPITLKS